MEDKAAAAEAFEKAKLHAEDLVDMLFEIGYVYEDLRLLRRSSANILTHLWNTAAITNKQFMK